VFRLPRQDPKDKKIKGVNGDPLFRLVMKDVFGTSSQMISCNEFTIRESRTPGALRGRRECRSRLVFGAMMVSGHTIFFVARNVPLSCCYHANL